jgi:F420-dependent hydroxymycolic acid dehydrogenase
MESQSRVQTIAGDPCLPERRTLLKSAGALIGVTAMGASRMSAAALPNEVAAGNPQTSSGTSGNVASGQLRHGMISFMLGHEQFPVPQLVEFGAAAEQAGFDLLSNSDHLQPWQSNEGHSGEAWVTMAALGQRTRRAWMGTTVTCPTFRYNPVVVAEAFASLSLLYPGRIFLGLGSGEALNEQAAVGSWPKWEERWDRLEEATDVIRRLWTGQQIDHKGKYYTVNCKLYDPPAKPIPILMAANGPKAMRRAGQHGDGLVTDPNTWKQHKAEFEAGAKAAGKDPGQMPVLVEIFVVVGDRKEAEKSAELWRFIPKAFKTYYNIRDPEVIQQRAEAELPLERVYSEWPVSTDPAVHIKAVTELFNSGATIVNVHSGQADQRKVIEFYGKQVIPQVRKAVKAA